MATRSASAPLTFDLPISLIAKIESHRRRYGLKTASEVVRLAIDKFDFEGCKPARDPHRQVSVRLGSNQRAMLKRYAKKKTRAWASCCGLRLMALPAKKSKSR
jgi:Arc/MetJ-type ribon-helix-helix transcriptional regulator